MLYFAPTLYFLLTPLRPLHLPDLKRTASLVSDPMSTERIGQQLRTTATSTEDNQLLSSTPLLVPATSKLTTRPNIPILTGLRGILSIWVLLHNFSWLESGAPDIVADWPLYSGSIAVSMFFSLSGFVMLYTYGNTSFTSRTAYAHFVIKRASRLLPIYWLSTLCCIGVEMRQVMQHGMDEWTILHWLATLTGTNTWWPWPIYERSDNPELRGMARMFNGSLWTIQTELGFYCLFPLLLALLRRILLLSSDVSTIASADAQRVTRLCRLKLLCGMMAMTSLLPTLLAASSPDILGVFCYCAPWMRLSEFVLGMLLALVYFYIVQQPRPIVVLYSRYTLDLAVLLIVTFMVFAKFITVPLLGENIGVLFLADNPGCFAPILTFILLLMLLSCSPLAGEQRRGVTSWLLTRPESVTMGELSFAFYVFGMVPYYYAKSIGARVQNSAAVEVCAALGMAVIGHYYVEKPIYQFVSQRLQRPERSTPIQPSQIRPI